MKTKSFTIKSMTGSDVWHAGVCIPTGGRRLTISENPKGENEVSKKTAAELRAFAKTATYGYPSKAALMIIDGDSEDETTLRARIAELEAQVAGKGGKVKP